MQLSYMLREEKNECIKKKLCIKKECDCLGEPSLCQLIRLNEEAWPAAADNEVTFAPADGEMCAISVIRHGLERHDFSRCHHTELPDLAPHVRIQYARTLFCTLPAVAMTCAFQPMALAVPSTWHKSNVC